MSDPNFQNSVGHLSRTAVKDSLINQTIDFIWSSIPSWRNDTERQFTESEEELNAQFHNFLQSRASREFPMVLFQHEQRQEGRRRVDLSVKPTETTNIEGVLYNIYKPIIVIEGKRLPTPSKSREREYVTSEPKISGGIQRFKLGLHGIDHEKVIILGYIQKYDPKFWLNQINTWILDLTITASGIWETSELLNEFKITASGLYSKSISSHPRTTKEGKKKPVDILHFWIQMTPEAKGRQTPSNPAHTEPTQGKA